MSKPALPVVVGSGWLADAMRRTIEADPDRYRPQTWSTTPVGECPCCGQDVYRAETRETGFEPGFMSHAGKLHPTINGVAGCCCVPGAWGPKHSKRKKPKRRAQK